MVGEHGRAAARDGHGDVAEPRYGGVGVDDVGARTAQPVPQLERPQGAQGGVGEPEPGAEPDDPHAVLQGGPGAQPGPAGEDDGVEAGRLVHGPGDPGRVLLDAPEVRRVVGGDDGHRAGVHRAARSRPGKPSASAT